MTEESSPAVAAVAEQSGVPAGVATEIRLQHLAGDRRLGRGDGDRVVRLLHLRRRWRRSSRRCFIRRATTLLALIAYLSTFAVGFVVRPFGALFFGRIGDLVGRKYAFLVTLLIMGGATALIGVLPTYATIGYAAPAILILIRILQGLALGGEYGGAAIYVAEHVPDDKRGFYTSFIQITATLGLFVSLAVILVVPDR